jgi:aminopeptidase N
MIKKWMLSFLLVGIVSPLFAQHQCNHRVNFGKSSLSDTLDVLSYHIFIDSILWDTDELYARTQLSLESKVDDLDHISLELMNFTVEEVLVDGQPQNYSFANNRLTIALDGLMQTGDQSEIWVTYHGVPFHESWGGFYIDNQYAYNLGVGFDADPHNLGKSWFPCVDDFHDRAIYDVTARVEDPLKAVAGGLLQDVTDHGDGTKSYHWHLEESIPTYLASVAVGDYEIYEDVYEGISADIPIKIYARPANYSSVEPSFIHLKQILTAFETAFGDYPFERVGYVGTSIGAMEHATNVAYPNFAIDGLLNYEYLYAHELSHMWFGDKVTCASAEDMWLNEGWATFCQMFYKESVYDEPTYKVDMMENLTAVLRSCHFTDGDYLALYGISHEYTYGMTVYDKGATVVQSLRAYLGDDVFFPAIQAYLQNYAYNYASSENMSDFLSTYTGVDMTDFFEAYVFTPGFSHFSVDSVQNLGGGQYEVFVRQKLKGKEVYANSNKVDVTLVDENWNQFDVRVEFDGESGSGVFEVPFEPVAALEDLHQNFSDATSDELQIIREPGAYDFTNCYFKLEAAEVPDSAFFRVTHNWVGPDPMQNQPEGLVLSDYRYYTIDGVIPESLQATGVFRYTYAGKLDHTLLGNPLDSLIILYRPNSGENWQSVPFERDGSPFVGYLRVPNVQKGQYTLAIWQEQFVNIKDPVKLSSEDYMQLYPNPSTGRVYFELYLPEKASLNVFDMNGKQVDSIQLEAQQGSARWDGRRMPKGQYVMKLVNMQGEELSEQKVILQ